MLRLEIACFDKRHAMIAYEAGADRIELCHDADSGGVSPIYEDLSYVKSHVAIPVFVMIRPRGGSFCYTAAELETMKSDIDRFKGHADGFVFGVLKNDQSIDVARTSELVRRSYPRPCTFHRAFDEVSSPLESLEDVIETGCSAILTSGGASSAIEGADMLAELVQKAADRITIIPGGGVRSNNLDQLQRKIGAVTLHSSGISKSTGKPDGDEIRTMRAMLLEAMAKTIAKQ